MLSIYKNYLNAYTQDPRTAPTESRQRYVFDAGSVSTQPVYLVGKVAAAVAAGMFVYISGSEDVSVALNGVTSTESGLLFAKCDPLAVGAGVPHGIVDSKPGDTVAIVRLLNPASDIDMAGAVAATLYVVGTDGYPAKSGDSTYPSGVAPYAVGIGLAGGKLLLLSGVQSSVTGGVAGNFANPTASTALAAAGPAAFDRTRVLAAGVLNASARRIDVEADFTLTASAASTHTGEVDLVIGASTITLASFSKSFGSSGTAVYKIRATIVTRVVGAAGFVRFASEVIASGAAPVLAVTDSSTPYSAGVDLTLAPTISATGGASAGTIILQNLLVRVS